MPLCSCCLVIVTNNLDLMPASASHQPQKEGTLSDWLRPGSTTGVLRPSTEIYVHETTNYQAGADDLTAVPTPLVHVFLARDVSIGCVVSAFTFGMDSELQLIVRRSECTGLILRRRGRLWSLLSVAARRPYHTPFLQAREHGAVGGDGAAGKAEDGHGGE